MTDFGPFISYSDPRLYGLIEGYRWGDFQRSLLLGQRSWHASTWNGDDRKGYKQKARDSVIEFLTERGFKVGMDRDGVLRVLGDLPPDDVMLPVLIEQWGLVIPKVRILSLYGPIEEIGGVPIFKACVFGYTERADGERQHGINNDAWIVGRMDVRRTFRMPAPWNWSQSGERVTRWDGVRGTLKRARNTASEVAEALPEWDAYLAWKTAMERAAEAARIETEQQAQDLEDEGLLGFVA